MLVSPLPLARFQGATKVVGVMPAETDMDREVVMLPLLLPPLLLLLEVLLLDKDDDDRPARDPGARVG